MLTQEALKQQFSYDPLTGVFTHLHNTTRRKKGDTAGWLINGYVRMCVNKKSYMAHRLAMLYMTGQMPDPKVDIDHKDGIRDNNKFSNLRLASRSQNNRNRKKHANNTSGYTGVDVVNGKYRARIRVGTNPDRKRLHLGHFNTAVEASIAYNKAALIYHGEFYNDTTRYPRT